MAVVHRRGSGRLHALLATVLCRLFVTLFMAMIAFSSARSWGVAWLLIGFGLAVDLARNLTLPDLRLPAAELARRVAADPATLRPEERLQGHGLTLFWALAALLWAYVLGLLMLNDIVGPATMTAWLDSLEPLQSFAADVIRIARRHAAWLESLGRSDRAVLVQHLYTAHGLLLVIGVIAGSTAAYDDNMHVGYHGFLYGHLGQQWSPNTLTWLGMGFFVLAVLVHFT